MPGAGQDLKISIKYFQPELYELSIILYEWQSMWYHLLSSHIDHLNTLEQMIDVSVNLYIPSQLLL